MWFCVGSRNTNSLGERLGERLMRARELSAVLALSLAAGFAACATATDNVDEDDEGSSAQTGGAGGTTGPSGGSAPGPVGPGPGGGGPGPAGPGSGGAGPGSGGSATGGAGGAGGTGGSPPLGTCDPWALGDLGAVGDQTGDIDVQYFEYQDISGVLEFNVHHAPFDPTTTTSLPGMRLADDGTNVIDLYWSAGAPVFESSTDGTTFTAIPSDPDLTIDVSDANVGGVITYTIPISVMNTYLTSATVATEVFGQPFAREGTTMTDQITSTTPNVRFTTRSQCNFIVPTNPDPSGDGTEVDFGAISYNAEGGNLRVRMDFWTPTAAPGEAQIYVHDATQPSGVSVIMFDITAGSLLMYTREEIFFYDWIEMNVPTSCTTNPTDLSMASDFFEIECPQSAIQQEAAFAFSAFSFASATHRMGAASFVSGTFDDDDFLPDAWTSYTQLDQITIP